MYPINISILYAFSWHGYVQVGGNLVGNEKCEPDFFPAKEYIRFLIGLTTINTKIWRIKRHRFSGWMILGSFHGLEEILSMSLPWSNRKANRLSPIWDGCVVADWPEKMCQRHHWLSIVASLYISSVTRHSFNQSWQQRRHRFTVMVQHSTMQWLDISAMNWNIYLFREIRSVLPWTE